MSLVFLCVLSVASLARRMVLATSATLQRQINCGLRVLKADGPSDGESFDAWVQRIGGDKHSGGWRAERSDVHSELARLSNKWLERDFIEMPRDKEVRLIYEHCRNVVAAWRHVFSAHFDVDMPEGWCKEVRAFKDLWLAAERQQEHRKSESGKQMKRHMMDLKYGDAVRIADECLHSAHAASSLSARYQLVQAQQTHCHGLLGPRGQKLSTKQTYGMSFFYPEFGAGTEYASELFRYSPCECNPPAVDLEHTPKGGKARTPLVLIPGRVFPVCPIVSNGLVRILQYGKQFHNASPPVMPPGSPRPDWPYLITMLDDISTAPAKLDMGTLSDVVKSLGLSTEGGMLSQLRHLHKLETSADPSCSTDMAHRAAAHGRTGAHRSTG